MVTLASAVRTDYWHHLLITFYFRKGEDMRIVMTSRNLIRAASLLALLLTFSVAADAQRGRWQSLGTAYVDGARDHDMIRVNARGAFTALQLGIKGGEIEFQRVVVHFENGGQQELEVRDRIP